MQLVAPSQLEVRREVRPAILSGWLYVPYEVIGGAARIRAVKKALTFSPRSQDADKVKTIEMFHDWVERGYLGVPRTWGLETFRGRLPLIDKTTEGPLISVPRLPDPNHPRCPDPIRQAQFIDNLTSEFERKRGFVAQAATGSGKTVCTLAVAGGVIRRRTLVLLHLERLMWQWAEEIKDKLGVSEDRIGIVQSDRCEWRDKDFVVGMLHSVAQREYERDFYRAFGLVVYDEVHKVGTEFFAPTVYRFNSRRWLGLSATVERDDGGERVFFSHLGKIAVTSEAEAMPMDVYPMRYTARKPPKVRNSRALNKALSQDPDRNRWLAGLIKRLYDAGRQAIIVGDFVEHAQLLMDLAAELGVPRDRMGQYTGQRHGFPYSPITQTMQTGAGYEATPIRWHISNHTGRPQALPTWRPVLGEDGKPVVNVPKVDIPGEELDRVKTTCQLVFATYGMLTEGIDEPRWDAGLDVVPRSKATQLTGRVRRKREAKKHPIWLTPYDDKVSTAINRFNKRCRDYRSTGAVIKEISR